MVTNEGYSGKIGLNYVVRTKLIMTGKAISFFSSNRMRMAFEQPDERHVMAKRELRSLRCGLGS